MGKSFHYCLTHTSKSSSTMIRYGTKRVKSKAQISAYNYPIHKSNDNLKFEE